MNKNPRGTKMKTIVSIVLVFAALISAPVFAQNNAELFSKEVERIVAQYEAKKISQSVAAKEIFIASKSYFPNDKLTQDYYQSVNRLPRHHRSAITTAALGIAINYLRNSSFLRCNSLILSC